MQPFGCEKDPLHHQQFQTLKLTLSLLLLSQARPGEQIEVTGIYTHTYDMNLNIKNGFPVFRCEHHAPRPVIGIRVQGLGYKLKRVFQPFFLGHHLPRQ